MALALFQQLTWERIFFSLLSLLKLSTLIRLSLSKMFSTPPVAKDFGYKDCDFVTEKSPFQNVSVKEAIFGSQIVPI